MDWVSRAAWMVTGGLAVALTARRLRLGIDRRRSAAAEGRHRHWFSFTLAGLLLAAVLAGWISVGLDRPVTISWLLAVNLVALAFYGWDKLAALLAVSRVPERTLHLLALVGGSVGALVAQSTFDHKTKQVGFQRKFWSVVALQAAVLIAYTHSRSTPS